jgi:predicted AlkP superfamily pyrophosphatase or phosphodiesterase
MDGTIGYLMEQLEKAGLKDNINVILVSDHGMVDMKETINVTRYVSANLINSTKTSYGIVGNIYPRNESVASAITSSLLLSSLTLIK